MKGQEKKFIKYKKWNNKENKSKSLFLVKMNVIDKLLPLYKKSYK